MEKGVSELIEGSLQTFEETSSRKAMKKKVPENHADLFMKSENLSNTVEEVKS